MIKLRFARQPEQQIDPAAIEESHVWRRRKKILHTELVAIELDCAFEIVGIDENLPDRGKTEIASGIHRPVPLIW